MRLEDLKPYRSNPRVNDRAVEVVAQSIQEFGFKNPIIVDANNVIIAGHTRFRASKRLGLEEVPVIVASDLTEEQANAFRIMDNKSSEFAEWDYEMLIQEINELRSSDYDVELTGFTEIEIDDILDTMAEDTAKAEAKKETPEQEFTPELLEEHQYVVLYFDNTLDWQVAQTVLGISPKRVIVSSGGVERTGLGRVINGSEVINRLKRGEENGIV